MPNTAANAPQQSRLAIRRAGPEDLEALTAVEPRHGIAERRLKEQDEKTGILGLVELNGEIVGMGFLDFVDEELVPELKNLWIQPDARRHGAGTALWEWLELRAAEASYTEVFLAVDPNNEKAIPLFLSLGYYPTGDHLLVDNPDTYQVDEPSQVSSHYAIYQKSLVVR